MPRVGSLVVLAMLVGALASLPVATAACSPAVNRTWVCAADPQPSCGNWRAFAIQHDDALGVHDYVFVGERAWPAHGDCQRTHFVTAGAAVVWTVVKMEQFTEWRSVNGTFIHQYNETAIVWTAWQSSGALGVSEELEYTQRVYPDGSCRDSLVLRSALPERTILAEDECRAPVIPR